MDAMVETAPATEIFPVSHPAEPPSLSGGTLHHHDRREIYVSRPFVIYCDEMERCYEWFVERCQAAARRHG